MELTEVVSPHVAVPVLGVLFCAVLVFAFGFKSPAQPPSFDFEDERKQNPKKGRKSKVKTPTNASVLEESMPKFNLKGTKPLSIVPKSKVSKNDNSSKYEARKDKSSQSKVNTAQSTRVKLVLKMSSEEEGEWEMQRSRKDKKQKPRKEDPSKRADKKELSADEPTKSDWEEGESASGAAAEQRINKKKRKSSKNKQADQLKVEPADGEDIAVSPAAGAAAAPTVEIKMETTAYQFAGAQHEVSEEFEVSPNKKTKKKREKTSTAPETVSHAASVSVPVKVVLTSATKNQSKTKEESSETRNQSKTKEESSETKNQSKKKEESSETKNQSKTKEESSGSPKKKKGKETEQAAHKTVKEVSKEILSEKNIVLPVQETKITVPVISDPSSFTEDTRHGPAASSKITFDEMIPAGGSADSWTEAPKTKKKRSRREN